MFDLARPIDLIVFCFMVACVGWRGKAFFAFVNTTLYFVYFLFPLVYVSYLSLGGSLCTIFFLVLCLFCVRLGIAIL